MIMIVTHNSPNPITRITKKAEDRHVYPSTPITGPLTHHRQAAHSWPAGGGGIRGARAGMAGSVAPNTASGRHP